MNLLLIRARKQHFQDVNEKVKVVFFEVYNQMDILQTFDLHLENAVFLAGKRIILIRCCSKTSQKDFIHKTDAFKHLSCPWKFRTTMQKILSSSEKQCLFSLRDFKIHNFDFSFTSISTNQYLFGWKDSKKIILTLFFTSRKRSFLGLKVKQNHSLLLQNFSKYFY